MAARLEDDSSQVAYASSLCHLGWALAKWKTFKTVCATRWYLDSSDCRKPASTSSGRRDGGSGGVGVSQGDQTPYSLPFPAWGGQNWPFSEGQETAPPRTGTVIITNEGYVFNREYILDGKLRFHPTKCLEDGPFG